MVVVNVDTIAEYLGGLAAQTDWLSYRSAVIQCSSALLQTNQQGVHKVGEKIPGVFQAFPEP